MIKGFAAGVVASIALMSAPVVAQDAAQTRAIVNDPVVGIMGASLDGQMTRMLADIANITSSDSVRVLPIIGQGSVNNIRDLLYLRGIDAAMMQSDALNFYEELGVEKDLHDKIHYIVPLGRQYAHLLARKDVNSIEELEGKRVNFGKATSGSVISATQIFDLLSINVEVTQTGHRKALKALKAGEIDAMFWMTPPPAALLENLPADENLHLLSIPGAQLQSDLYPAGKIAGETYPFLQGDVETVSTVTVLAAYNWKPDNARRQKVERFADALRNKFEDLRSDDYHASFQTMNLEENIPGDWKPFN